MLDAGGSEKGDPEPPEDEPLPTDPIYDESLFAALYQSFKPRILGSGLLLLVSGPWPSVKSCRALVLTLAFRRHSENDVTTR